MALFGTVAIDLVVPVAGYYVLRGFGLDQLLALILAGSPTAVVIVYRAVRRRAVNALGIFVLAVLGGSIALSFITGSPRFLLAKEGWFTAAIGGAFLVSLRFRRPLAFSFARAMVQPTRLGERLNVSSWDALRESDARVRRIWRTATVLWGVVMIADAVVRVVIAYVLPVDVVPLVGGVLWGVTFVVVQVAQHRYFEHSGLWRRLAQPSNRPESSEGPAA
ncbi:hypothetical protein SAMN04489806_0173 [Paramicrobacterium humi]|uniref:Intracellular septation protein A n=1 Tax=Paramicrobacterium humi TaxID=640635 RepID=A0A1H4IRM8_9MICO|nr:hypothetical protein SAMN04489806_0173 [Microbacterium humi]